MKAPQITYLYRTAVDTAQNTLEVFRRRLLSTSSVGVSVFAPQLYTVPSDHIAVLSNFSATVRSLVIVPFPAAQRIRATLEVFDGLTTDVLAIRTETHLLNPATTDPSDTTLSINWDGEVWLRPGTTVRLNAVCTSADTLTIIQSLAGFLIPKGNVSFVA